MRVLAVDPGYGRCGLAVLERQSGKDILLHSCCVETPSSLDFPSRLAMIMTELDLLLAAHKPDCVAMEKLYFNKSRTTAMRVAEVRGAIIASAAAARIPVSEYAPGEVKSAATGDGRADKKQVARMIHALVKIERPIRLDDEYDAIAIGVTHLSRAGGNFARLLQRS